MVDLFVLNEETFGRRPIHIISGILYNNSDCRKMFTFYKITEAVSDSEQTQLTTGGVYTEGNFTPKVY